MIYYVVIRVLLQHTRLIMLYNTIILLSRCRFVIDLVLYMKICIRFMIYIGNNLVWWRGRGCWRVWWGSPGNKLVWLSCWDLAFVFKLFLMFHTAIFDWGFMLFVPWNFTSMLTYIVTFAICRKFLSVIASNFWIQVFTLMWYAIVSFWENKFTELPVKVPTEVSCWFL